VNRSIATLAWIKATWDNTENRQDYIQLYVPLVITLFHRKRYKRVKPNTICKDFQELYGLSIPYHPMLAILNRARQKGYLRKNKNGGFAPEKDKIEQEDFSDDIVEQERQYRYVISQFIEFSATEYNQTISTEDAEQIFIAFLRDHDLDLLFMSEDMESMLPPAGASASQKFLMNKFVLRAYESEPTIFQSILDYSIGHIYASALTYYNDSPEATTGDLAKCAVYLDVGFLFNLTGINDQERQEAYSEFLAALKDQNADLRIFRHTYEEFRSIVEGSRQWINNASYNPRLGNRTTEFFIDNEFSSSDVDQFILGIDSTLT